MSKTRTHSFGYRQVTAEDKTALVGDVFDSVAPHYDLMNDLMSLGIHRLWKRITMQLSVLQPGQRVLDLAAGTGDLTRQICHQVGAGGYVVSADINQKMLAQGRDHSLDSGPGHGVGFVRCNAENLPFPDHFFDRVIIGFGLRNVTDMPRTLRAMRQVLKRGGRVLILEFSRPLKVISPLYDLWSLYCIPKLARKIARDEESYRYLVESIRLHPDQETLKEMMGAAGFERCEYFNLSGGIVAVHRGCRI